MPQAAGPFPPLLWVRGHLVHCLPSIRSVSGEVLAWKGGGSAVGPGVMGPVGLFIQGPCGLSVDHLWMRAHWPWA